MGDGYRARQELVTQIYCDIEAKRLQIEITKLQADARKNEAEAGSSTRGRSRAHDADGNERADRGQSPGG